MTDRAAHQDDSAHSPDWDAIARFLSGESSDAEATAVREWLGAHPEDRELVDRLNAAAVVEPADVDVEAALRVVHSRMTTNSTGLALTFQRGTRRGLWQHRGIIVPVLAAAAVIVAYVSVRRGQTIASGGTATASRVYATPIGRRDSVVLADGSKVILGPDSHLTVPTDYALNARKVELGGDAYFEVRHDPTKPFSVRVGQALVEDVGTTFTVESDAGDTVSVSVMSGRVRLRASGSSRDSGAVLGTGDRGSFAGSGSVQTYPHSATADDSAWTTGRLIFHDASLVRVAGEIHRWYGVTVRIADSSLAERHVTASFNGESVDQVLRIIGLTLGAQVDRQGDSAIVHSIRGPVAPR